MPVERRVRYGRFADRMKKNTKRLKFTKKIVAFLKPSVQYPKWYLLYSDFSGKGSAASKLRVQAIHLVAYPWKRVIIRLTSVWLWWKRISSLPKLYMCFIIEVPLRLFLTQTWMEL